MPRSGIGHHFFANRSQVLDSGAYLGINGPLIFRLSNEDSQAGMAPVLAFPEMAG